MKQIRIFLSLRALSENLARKRTLSFVWQVSTNKRDNKSQQQNKKIESNKQGFGPYLIKLVPKELGILR
jgi:hypothetical protein